MAWMLQPHSYTQIIRPNLYNVAYKRTGTYKGMGRDVSVGPTYYPNSIPRMGFLYRRGLGQTSCDENGNCTDISSFPITGYSGGVTPTSLAMSNLETAGAAQTMQTQLQQQGLTQALPWILGGVVLIALVARR